MKRWLCVLGLGALVSGCSSSSSSPAGDDGGHDAGCLGSCDEDAAPDAPTVDSTVPFEAGPDGTLDARLDEGIETSLDASPEASADAPLDATDASAPEAGAPDDAATQLPTSCADLQARQPTAASGVYTLLLDGVTSDAYCDMDLAGGGWTTFFAGTNGSSNVFDHFEQTTDDCSDPATHCLRRIPAGVTTATPFAASCGAAAVTFNVNDLALAYFQSGTQNQWQPLGDATSVAGGAVASYASQLWTGDGTNQGWILSLNDLEPNSTSNTFAQSYDWNATWDYCNGQPDQASPVRLMYR